MAAQQAQASRDQVVSTGLSEAYLTARIDTLYKMLLRQFEDILFTAYSDEPNPDEEQTPPSLVDTANRQLAIDVATMSMIRAAEELMVMTRTMKELWLFGDLDTLVKDQSPEGLEKREQLERDEEAVVKGMHEWLQKNSDMIYDGPRRVEEPPVASEET